MKIRITGTGIYGKDGELAVGTELSVKNEPKGWEGRYEVLSGDTDGKEPVTNSGDGLDRDDLKKQASELGIEFARNIATDKLKELIDAKLAE